MIRRCECRQSLDSLYPEFEEAPDSEFGELATRFDLIADLLPLPEPRRRSVP